MRVSSVVLLLIFSVWPAAAQETGSAAGEVLSAAGELNQQSNSLNSEVEGFLRKIRAA